CRLPSLEPEALARVDVGAVAVARVVVGEHEGALPGERRAIVGGRGVAEMVSERLDALAREPEVRGDQAQALALAQIELAAGRLDEAQARAELPGPAGKPAPLVETDAVVLPRVGRIVEDAIHPVARIRAEAGQGDQIDGGRGETELAQERGHRLARVAGVVLQPAEPLLGRAGDDLAVTQDRRGRTVGFGNAEDDHRDVILSHRPPRPQRVLRYRPAAEPRRPREEVVMTIEDTLRKAGLTIPSLEDLYRTNASGAHYISHFPVQNLLYLSGTTPRKDGQGYLPGVVGKDLTVAQGYEAARYAA